MNRWIALTAALAVAALSGCATTHPQNAAEFRAAVPGSMMGKKETFDVERPFRDVAGTYKKKAEACLDMTIETTSSTPGQYGPVVQKFVTTYKPTVIESPSRVELHVQHHMDGMINVTKEPAGGYYLMVVDAYPVDDGTTRVDVYRPAMGYGLLAKAVRGWSTGSNSGCPDLAKM